LKYKLLLADDSVTIQRVIELTFAEEDIEVITVGDGQSAIDRLESDPPDIVLADVDMPRRDGYQVAEYVRSRPRLAHIPVVLLTGAFEPIDHARAAAAGSSDSLAKPFEPKMVIKRVKRLLGEKEDERPEPFDPFISMPARDEPATKPAPAQPVWQTTGEATQEAVSLDDYFDRLDAAFSNLHQSDNVGQRDSMHAANAWLADDQGKQPQEIPETRVGPAAPPEASANPFAELTAATGGGIPAPASPPVPDALIDEVVTRVLQRLSDRVVRETVTEIVSKTAERLIHEEILRIKTEGR
jgi:CheY-like chemotaxis protein